MPLVPLEFLEGITEGAAIVSAIVQRDDTVFDSIPVPWPALETVPAFITRQRLPFSASEPPVGLD
jgi:hypothetical protein